MVHEKYIKKRGKTYGPYYYESYREGGKVKKRYVKNENKGRRVKKARSRKLLIFEIFYLSFLFVLIVTIITAYAIPRSVIEKFKERPDLLFAPPQAASGSNGNANLATWDDTDTSVKRSGDLIGFFAEFTRLNDGTAIDNTAGICRIRYNFDGSFTSFEDMNYNPTDVRWESSRAFNYKGNHIFEVECNSANEGTVLVSNNFIISNIFPIFSVSRTTTNGVEDTPVIANFSEITVEPDVNDVLSYAIEGIEGPLGAGARVSDYTWISIERNTGILIINSSKDSETGFFAISVLVTDSDNEGVSLQYFYNIAPVNDPPVFTNLENKSFNMSELFDYIVIATDEEGDVPFSFNITFLSCNLAGWSTRTDCKLFGEGDYEFNDTSINISFTPSKNDVGSYLINFSVNDSRNARRSELVNFTVINRNDAPYFTYVCDNERTAFEDVEFSCYINASDLDEVNNLTFRSNQAWFLDFANATVNSITQFNGSALVNFTPSDLNVGNWSINVTVTDTGGIDGPVRSNSSVFPFFVENRDDSVVLENIDDVTVYSSNNYHAIYINASDNDLLIPNKNVYNEIISFESGYAGCVTVRSLGVVSGTNITRGIIEFNPSDGACFAAESSYNVGITVRDANLYSSDSDVFVINVDGNNPPQWVNVQNNQTLTEDESFNLDLSLNVFDADGDTIRFSYASNNAFPTFSLNRVSGVINFIPLDSDVGQHIVIINASDGKTPTPLAFNFTVRNVNDAPLIEEPILASLVVNASVDANSNIDATEDNTTTISFFVQDDDFKIPLIQKAFYDERLNINLTAEGPNASLFSFSRVAGFPGPGSDNKALFTTTFIPRKADVGVYNITINVSDMHNASDVLYFNLTIFEINHPPEFLNLVDLNTAVNRTLYYDINASDLEEGDDISGNLTYSYTFLPDGRGDFIRGDEKVFNITSGVLNYTFNDLEAGVYHINMSVRDPQGLRDVDDFRIFVHEKPKILSPAAGFVFNLTEGNAKNLTFIANSSTGFNLSYRFYINGNLRKSVENYYGNATGILWSALPAFVDETYGLFGNLSLTISIPGFESLNTTMDWNANITHGNAPIEFIKSIGDKEGIAGRAIIINLSEHFSDVDAFDAHYNQSASFIVRSNVNSSGIISGIGSNGWTLALTASSPLVEFLDVVASDLINSIPITNATSNVFKVEFKEPIVINVPQPTSGGGGGGSSEREQPVAFRIILPGPVSARLGENISLPIEVVNEGPFTLRNINLGSLIFKDGLARDDVRVYLDRDFIPDLNVGESENLTLIVELATRELGLFEITVNASVESPRYFDWGKIFINVQEGETTIERLVFTEQFIAENPECAEVKELVDESREFLALGDFSSAQTKLNDAVQACKEIISQQSFFSRGRFKDKIEDKVFLYLLIATIIAIVLGIGYYSYRIIVFRKALRESVKRELEG